MSYTKHLPILQFGWASFTPSLYMISFHFFKAPNLIFVYFSFNNTVWTIADAFFFSFLRLAFIKYGLLRLVKDPNFQKTIILAAT